MLISNISTGYNSDLCRNHIFMGKPKYTGKEIDDILRLLQLNKYNYVKTSKETGVARNTLYAWVKTKDFTPVLPAEKEQDIQPDLDNINGAIVHFDPEVSEERDDLLEDIIKAKKLVLKEIMALAPGYKNLDALGRIFQILDQCHKSSSPITGPNNQQINLVAILGEQLSGNNKTNND